MDEDPLVCEDCGTDLSHDEIETVAPVFQLDIETFQMDERAAEVYRCGGCGAVIGFDLQ